MTVVLAYLPTAEGSAALAAGLEEVKRRQTDVVVVNVLRPTPEGDESFSDEQQLDAVVQKFAHRGITARARQLPPGTDPVDAIIDEANAVAAELVILGLRRRSPIAELRLGHTTQRLLLGLDCPILSVKAV